MYITLCICLFFLRHGNILTVLDIWHRRCFVLVWLSFSRIKHSHIHNVFEEEGIPGPVLTSLWQERSSVNVKHAPPSTSIHYFDSMNTCCKLSQWNGVDVFSSSRNGCIVAVNEKASTTWFTNLNQDLILDTRWCDKKANQLIKLIDILHIGHYVRGGGHP